MKHCKVEFDDAAYEIIREAAYQARQPIRRWVAIVAADAARHNLKLDPIVRDEPTDLHVEVAEAQ